MEEGTASMHPSFCCPSSSMAKPQGPSGKERKGTVYYHLEALTLEWLNVEFDAVLNGSTEMKCSLVIKSTDDGIRHFLHPHL